MIQYSVLVAILYFIPSIIALFHKRENKFAIFALNFLLGWTFIGWVIALVWALTSNRPRSMIREAVSVSNPTQKKTSYDQVVPGEGTPSLPMEKRFTLRKTVWILTALLLFAVILSGILRQVEINRELEKRALYFEEQLRGISRNRQEAPPLDLEAEESIWIEWESF